MFVLKPWQRGIWLSAIAGIAITVLVWLAWWDPAINYLPRDNRAEWIVFPTAVDPHAHWFASLDTIFRREVTLANHPATAPVRIRAMRRAEVKVNGVPLRFPPGRNWKEIKSIDIAE